MHDAPPRITVAVVTHNSEAVVGDCLRSLPDGVGDAAVHDVVVVDNASTDGTIGVARGTCPGALLLRLAGNRGYAAGINAAVERRPGGIGDALLVLNPDVRLEPGAVKHMLAALRSPGVGIVVPRLVDADGVRQTSLRRDPTVLRAFGEALLGGRRAGRFERLGEVVTDPARYQRGGDVDWASGAVVLVSRQCLDTVGRWDESFFLYSEEIDFAQRARAAGYSVRFEPAATAVHLGGQSNVDPALWSLLTRNRVRLFRRGHGAVATAAFTTAVLLNEATRAAAGRATSRAALGSLMSRRAGGPTTAAGAQARSAPPGIICFSAQDWWYFNHAHSDFQLVTRAARERPVLLVNSIGMRLPLPGRTRLPLTRIARKARSLTRGLRRPLDDVPGFAVLSPVFLPVYRPGRLREVNARLVRWQVERAARRLGIADATMVVTLPTAWDVVEPMRRRGLLANRSDRYSAFAEADAAWVTSLERDLLAAADIAVYAGRRLLDDERRLTRRPVLLDHGVDLDLFDPDAASGRREPRDLAAIPHPRLGYFGAVDDYTVDLGLLERLAKSMPDAQVVLVGPANCPLDGLTSLPNVHWLGPKPLADVPSYGAGFDVALMPWLDNDWIEHCNPIKLKEYLALGLPVVTTPFPEVERYAELIRIAPADEFVSAVEATLHDGGPADPARRRAAVTCCSWDERARELIALCDEAAAAARAVTRLGPVAQRRVTVGEATTCAVS